MQTLPTHSIYYKGLQSKDRKYVTGTFGFAPNSVKGKFCMKNSNHESSNNANCQKLNPETDDGQWIRETPDTPAWREAREFVQNIIDAGQPFTDSDFPPEMSSLWKEMDEPETKKRFENFRWSRASELFNNPVVFDGIDPSDIKQGLVGDCYFLAILSALAE